MRIDLIRLTVVLVLAPALGLVGPRAAGASGTTQNLTRARVCGFHDHNQPDVTALQGTITIQ